MNDENIRLAEMLEAEARISDLSHALERMTEQRDSARASADLLLHEVASLEEALASATARIDRLMIHLHQGIEL
jgi:predicted  nucleic acid-binding Zn-ribbon protein